MNDVYYIQSIKLTFWLTDSGNIAYDNLPKPYILPKLFALLVEHYIGLGLHSLSETFIL